VAATALLAGLAGPAAYSLATAATPHSGSIPSAGPSVGGFAVPVGQPPGGAPLGGGTRNGNTTGSSPGGLLDGSTPSTTLTRLLSADASSYTWVAAAVGSNSAAGYQLATRQPVMAIGGFNGSDPSPTLARFQEWVAAGKIHYFIASGGMGGVGGGLAAGGNTASQIARWVENTFTAQSVDGVTVYDLSAGS
jgi:hypothetical protein